MGPARGVIVVVIVGTGRKGDLTWHTDSCEMCAGWSFGQHLIHSTGLCSVRFASVWSALVWFGLGLVWFCYVQFRSIQCAVSCPVLSYPVTSCLAALFLCVAPLPLGSPPRVLANWPSGNEHNNISASSNNNKHVEDRERARAGESEWEGKQINSDEHKWQQL